MNQIRRWSRRWVLAVCLTIALRLFAETLVAQAPATIDPPQYGPYNGVFLFGGEGLRAPLIEHDSVLRADSAWTLSCWVRVDEAVKAPTLVAGLGDTTEEYPRYLSLDADSLSLVDGQGQQLARRAGAGAGKVAFLGGKL